MAVQPTRSHFASSGIEPLVLSYEEDVEPRSGDAVSRVLAHVGVELPPLWSPDSSTVRQSDGLNDAWQEAYDREATVRLTA